jgi:hypothetical protein
MGGPLKPDFGLSGNFRWRRDEGERLPQKSCPHAFSHKCAVKNPTNKTIPQK